MSSCGSASFLTCVSFDGTSLLLPANADFMRVTAFMQISFSKSSNRSSSDILLEHREAPLFAEVALIEVYQSRHVRGNLCGQHGHVVRLLQTICRLTHQIQSEWGQVAIHA